MTRVEEKISDGRVLELSRRTCNSDDGRAGAVDRRRGHPARRGHQSAVGQYLSQPAGPLCWPRRDSRWCGTRTTSSSCAAAQRKRSRRWPWCNAGRRRPGCGCIRRRRRSWTARNPEALTFLGITSSAAIAGRGRRACTKLKDTVRGKTRRTNGHSLATIIEDVNRTLRGWFEYFKHSHRYVSSRWMLDPDAPAQHPAQTRRRTRRGPRREHHRWPNAFFAAHGLFSLAACPCCRPSILVEVTPQLESRMREIRLSGSEGGGSETNRFSLPLSGNARAARHCLRASSFASVPSC